jgi:hypothetical protein
MDERKPPSAEDIRGILERLDEIRHESERARDRADYAMRQRPFWPDRRKTTVSEERSEAPDRRKKPT